MTEKAVVMFSGFLGFPGAIGTLFLRYKTKTNPQYLKSNYLQKPSFLT